MIDILRSKPQGARLRAGALTLLARLRRAAWAFTTRRIRAGASDVTLKTTTPQAGDLVLAQIDAIGYHSGLQLPEGRRKQLFIGDEIVVAYGNRYAPNQFEAVVPKTLGPCQLVAAGGIAGKARRARRSGWCDQPRATLRSRVRSVLPLGAEVGGWSGTCRRHRHRGVSDGRHRTAALGRLRIERRTGCHHAEGRSCDGRVVGCQSPRSLPVLERDSRQHRCDLVGRVTQPSIEPI